MEHRTALQCALTVLLVVAGRAVDANSGHDNNRRYSPGGTACRYAYASLKYVCDKDAGLTAVPSPCCLPHVRYLEMPGSLLASLRKRELGRRFSGLLGADLSNNRIQRIHRGAFDGLGRLQTLDLSGNRLTSLADGVFDELGSLTSLDLGGNGMASLHQGAFAGLPSLTRLRLDSNRLRTIPDEVFEPLRRLRSLSLDDNHLARLSPDSFGGLGRLETLSMARNRLASLPDFLAELPALGDLVLGSNPLVCDCRLAPLRRWLSERPGRRGWDKVLCASPARLRGVRLASVRESSLCQLPDRHSQSVVRPSTNLPSIEGSSSSSSFQDHGGWGPGGAGGGSHPDVGGGGTSSNSGPGAGAGRGVTSTPESGQRTVPVAPATAAPPEPTRRVFFDDIPASARPPGRPGPSPGRPGVQPQTPSLTKRPWHGLVPVRPVSATPRPRPTRPSPGGPTANGTESSGPVPRPGPPYDRPPGKPETGSPTSAGNERPTPGTSDPALAPPKPGPNDRPTVDSGKPPEASPNGSSSSPERPAGPPERPNKPAGHPPGPEATTPLPGSPTESVMVIEPDGDVDGEGDKNSTVGFPITPLMVYGVQGHSVVLLCGNAEIGSNLLVRWLLPNGRPISGLMNSRFKVEKDGSLRIRPLRGTDTGSYRCILQSEAASKVILVRLRKACPCSRSEGAPPGTSDEGATYDDLPPDAVRPVPAHACSWTPLVIAVVTTFQGTVAACAMAFCVWYTRCHRRKNFTIRVEEAEKRSKQGVRTSNATTASRDCPSSATVSLADSTYEQGPPRPSDHRSVSGPNSARTSHTLSDYMNASVPQRPMRDRLMQQLPAGVPIPDYVDLDPNSRDPHESLYSSLRGRDFNNRRRRIVTH